MTPEKLLSAMTDLDDEIILEAKASPVHKQLLTRRRVVVLAAAILLMTLTVTAAANPDTANWFRQFFRAAGNRELSQGQQQYIEENTVAQKQSQTCSGYTITVDSVISDGVTGYIQMTLTGPEGTVLDADKYSCDHFDLLDETGNDSHRGGGLDSADQDPTDNIVPLFLELVPPVGTTDIANLTEHTWTLKLEDLIATDFINWNTPDFELRHEPLTQGLWEFEITFAEDTTVIEVIREPVPCPAEVMQWPEWGDEEIHITSLRLRAMSADMVFSFPLKEDPVNARIGEIYLVRKDGSQLLMRESANWPNGIRFSFDAPIALEEVSHVLLPNGTKIPMP